MRCNRPGRAAAQLAAGFLILLTAASCVAITYPQKESYWENTTVSENHTELYSVVVPQIRSKSGEEPILPYVVWSNPELSYNTLKHIWYYGFRVPPHDNCTIRLLFLKQSYYEFLRVNVYDFDDRGQILPPPIVAGAENMSLPSGPLTGVGSWNYWINSADDKLTYARPLASVSDVFLNQEGNHIVEFNTHGSREVGMLITGPSSPLNCHFTASLSWTDYTTENTTTTEERIVTSTTLQPELKTRSSNLTRQVPLWDLLFNR